ncbi:hypothetical protein BYT27DRAFT_6615699 [Phlegmacium glaucopus]|nr:hypothetical protein BYT27DRAFT_6615699 [Phlegmacium glaucopus]
MSTGLPSHKAGQLDSELFTPTSTVPQLSSGSVYLSSSLQRTANEEQPEQDIFHLQKPVQTSGPIPQPAVTPISNHLPSPQTSQPEREPFTSYIPTHPSGSRFLSFSLQKAANKQPDLEQGIPQPPNLVASRTFGSIPQSATAPRLPSVQATRFLRSPFQEVPPSQQPEYGQNIGLNLFAAGQDSFYLPPISSPHVNQRFPSNPPLPSAFPLAQSLLFLPPNPPPKTKFNFSPFSPEEDTVPLPPAPRVKSNQHGITLPVRDLPPLSATRDYTVPYPPMFPPQSFDDLSPLPIALLLSPWAAAPDELNIKISGPQGYLNADNYQAHITRFLLSRINEVANSLVVVWQLSHVDSGGARGMMSLKALFVQLDEKVPNSDRTALSGFSKLSITIPDLVKDVTPCNNPIEEVDLTNAVELLEFIWHGDFAIFAFKFKNLSFATLTVLNLKSSHLSIEDAVTLLHSCPDLQTASLGIIQNEEDCDAVLPFKPSAVQRKILPRLAGLALESNVALHPLVVRIGWTGQINLSLTLRKQGTGNIHKLPLRWGAVSNIELNCHLTAQELFNVKRAFPSVIYHDMNI